jgi:hypothetical protein
MEVHQLFDADTCKLVNTFKSNEDVLRATQAMQQQTPSILVLRRMDDNQYDDENYTYFLYKDDIKDEPQTELKQPPSLIQLVKKPSVKPSEHMTPQNLSALDKYYHEIFDVSNKRFEECKRCHEQSRLRQDAIKTLVKTYIVNVLKEYDRKFSQVSDAVDQTNTFCDTFLKGGIQSVIQALRTTKYSHDERYTTLMDFLASIDKEYSEEGLTENYAMVQHVLNTSKTAVDMQRPALKFCHGRIEDYIKQIDQGEPVSQQWRDIIFRAKDLLERQEIALSDFEKSKKKLTEHLQRNDRDSGLLIMSAQTELEERQIEKRLSEQDEELREVLWKCIELACKENGRIKMEPMMKLRQRMAQFLATLDGVYQTVQKTLVRGSLARIKFAYHLPSIYPTCIAEVLRRKHFKTTMQIELDNLIEILESAFRGENGERAKYDKQIKLKIGDDEVHRDILDQLVPGLLDKIRETEIIADYRQLKDRTLNSFDTKLLQQVDAVNKEEAEFVFVEEDVDEAKQKDSTSSKEPKKDPQKMAENMSATMFFNEVTKHTKDVKEMMTAVNQHEKARQLELQQKKQQKLQQLQERAQQIDDDNSDSDGETQPQTVKVDKKQAEEIEQLRNEIASQNIKLSQAQNAVDQVNIVRNEQEREIEMLRQKLKVLQENDSAKQNEILSLQHTTESLQVQNQQLRNHIVDLEQNSAKKEKELQIKEEQIREYGRKNVQFEDAKRNADAEVQKLLQQNRELQKTLELNQGEHAKNMSTQMERQVLQHKSQVMSLENECSRLQKALREKSDQAQQLTNETDALRKEISELQNAAAKNVNELQRTKTQCSNLEEELALTRRNIMTEKKRVEETMKQLERENNILLEEKERAQRQIEKIAVDLEAKMKQASKLQAEVQQLQEASTEAVRLRKESDERALKMNEELHKAQQEVSRLELQLRKAQIVQKPVTSGDVSPIVAEYEKRQLESDAKIKQLSELVSNSTKVIANLNNKSATLEKAIEALKKQFTHTMTHRMAALTEASRKLSEAQAQVNQSGTSYERQQKIFRLNLIQQGKIVRETISEYVEIISALSSVSPLVGDLVDYTKQSLGDMDQILTQCEVMCREEIDSMLDDTDNRIASSDKRTVVLSGFSVDDRMVFFRSQRNQELWEAFNVGMPNYFLSPEAVLSLKHKMNQHYAQTHVAIGIAVEIEKCNCVENSTNPLKLSGPYHIVTAVLE